MPTVPGADDGGLLGEQITFYRRRAPEYDEWWMRTGPYDRGPEEAAEWAAQVSEVERALEAFPLEGSVLELAGGTGWWTTRLAARARALTVVDSSEEALAINRDRVGRDDVDYVGADIFGWRPADSHSYDSVFFSFWLSHVPRARFGEFWRLVRSCLRPGGRVFLVDNRHDPTWDKPDPHVLDSAADVQSRRLSDGSVHRVVKVFYEPADLERAVEAEGWDARVHGTRWLIYGDACPVL